LLVFPLYKCFSRRQYSGSAANSNAGSAWRAVPNAGYVFKVYQGLDLHSFNTRFTSTAFSQPLGVYTVSF